jgi:hypothetical protein
MSQLAIERWGVVRISRSERGWFMEENIFAEHNKMSKCMGSPSLCKVMVRLVISGLDR